MLRSEGFAPHWASAPGDTVRLAADRRGLSNDELCAALHLGPVELHDLLEGRRSISLQLARQLTAAVGGSPTFWITRDSQYRDDLAWREAEAWSSQLPLADMVRRGWIPDSSHWQDRVQSCLSYFGVDEPAEWNHTYGTTLNRARFRSSPSAKLLPGSVAAWMRRAELQVREESTAPWDPELVRDSLPRLKAVSKIAKPATFIPQIKQIANQSGFRVAIIEAPEGCQASGLAYFPEPNRPLVVLSARYRSDDHLWFSLFHEVGHLVLHSPDHAFIDDLSIDSAAQSAREIEADQFAQKSLVPVPVLEEALDRRRLDSRTVVRLAIRAGVAPGVLVGMLQHTGVVDYDRMNFLKRRYRWNGPILESA